MKYLKAFAASLLLASGWAVAQPSDLGEDILTYSQNIPSGTGIATPGIPRGNFRFPLFKCRHGPRVMLRGVHRLLDALGHRGYVGVVLCEVLQG